MYIFMDIHIHSKPGKSVMSDNVLCNVFKDVAVKELLTVDSNASY